MAGKPSVVYSYLRFSRPEQMRGDSLRRQLDASRQWAESRGLKIAEPFQDLGVSAFRSTNATSGKFAAFLRLTEQKRVAPGSVLVVESLDRLSRAQVSSAPTVPRGSRS